MVRRGRKPAPDQAQRDAAISERQRNVLIDAGAGTGKTTVLVDRLVEMVAPSSSGSSVSISRIAAITFTRKAAGELRLRIRERLLEELAEVQPGTERDAQLRDAIAGLDTAHVGTIHSFADRLLRLRPVEARLSPSYEITEDDTALVHETFEVLLHAAESGTLAAELRGTEAAVRADKVTEIILTALDAGLRVESREGEWLIEHGLDALVKGFIRLRDVPPPDAAPAPFDAASFRAAADEFVNLATPVRRGSPGADWIARTAEVLRRLGGCDDPVQVSREVRQQLDRTPRSPVTKRDTFAGEDASWQVWKAFKEGGKLRKQALRDDLLAPIDRWMATRLVRLFPVVMALYEKIKTRRRQLDQLDLLLKLRDLLAMDKTARGEYQRMFDHVFVDEFQDTDPLQAEIVLYLCEREPRADRWEEVVLSEGKLTLVGDPKQSIYRFRRADVAMYDRVRGVVARGAHLEARLSANFRSVPPLIEWLNDRFARVLGTPPDGRAFDPATGRVFQQPLTSGREGATGPAMWILPFDFGDGGKHGVDEYRQLEGRGLARFLRWLVESGGTEIVDPLDGRRRPVRYGDVAVLAVSTWQLPLLFSRLDAEGVPYASRGGTIFLEDPLHRQFLLGLRALADRDDGVAEAALLRPPFFAVDLADLLRERGGAQDEQAGRARDARELVRELRRRRFDRSPGATARDLLDRTAFARAVAVGPNGAQRLSRLRELCLVFEQVAANERLDYDAATACLREWIEAPVQLDPPHPVGTEAVQIMTVHQAKGLEFPVVALWDGKGRWDTRPDSGAWRMERDGRGWMLDLAGLTWEEPTGLDLRQSERLYLDAERRRVVYVAATRARDLLVVPKAGDVPPGRFVCGDLLADGPAQLTRTLEAYVESAEPAWEREVSPPVRRAPGDTADLEQRVADRWGRASREAARPHFRPASVSKEARTVQTSESDEALDETPPKQREGRYGGVFGSAVHHAIGLVIRDGNITVQEAVRRAAGRFGLTEHLEEAAADVARAVDALRAAGLARSPSADLQLEYPIAGPWDGGQLMSGYIDLVAVTEDRVDIIDFKTDAPPRGPVKQAYPEYVSQVRAYGRLLGVAGIAEGRRFRCGLLFTADGSLHWVGSS
ncbi:MAG: UvrD-helicase domain-containing protein [Planctomycetes bacterium]|nr:UvrD-helicase domain-containing protein [Planctomycetota bacterium]